MADVFTVSFFHKAINGTEVDLRGIKEMLCDSLKESRKHKSTYDNDGFVYKRYDSEVFIMWAVCTCKRNEPKDSVIFFFFIYLIS